MARTEATVLTAQREFRDELLPALGDWRELRLPLLHVLLEERQHLRPQRRDLFPYRLLHARQALQLWFYGLLETE